MMGIAHQHRKRVLEVLYRVLSVGNKSFAAPLILVLIIILVSIIKIILAQQVVNVLGVKSIK
jgi:hypothetical protein